MSSEASLLQISWVVNFFIPRTCLYVCHYIYIYCTYGLTTNTMPTRIVCAHSHLFLTLIAHRRGNQITIETESEQERDCTQSFIKDKYTLFISTRPTLLQRYLSACNKDVASNKVATLRSVQSRIANIFCYVLLLANNKNQQLQIPLINLHSPFNVLHSVLV